MKLWGLSFLAPSSTAPLATSFVLRVWSRSLRWDRFQGARGRRGGRGGGRTERSAGGRRTRRLSLPRETDVSSHGNFWKNEGPGARVKTRIPAVPMRVRTVSGRRKPRRGAVSPALPPPEVTVTRARNTGEHQQDQPGDGPRGAREGTRERLANAGHWTRGRGATPHSCALRGEGPYAALRARVRGDSCFVATRSAHREILVQSVRFRVFRAVTSLCHGPHARCRSVPPP